MPPTAGRCMKLCTTKSSPAITCGRVSSLRKTDGLDERLKHSGLRTRQDARRHECLTGASQSSRATSPMRLDYGAARRCRSLPLMRAVTSADDLKNAPAESGACRGNFGSRKAPLGAGLSRDLQQTQAGWQVGEAVLCQGPPRCRLPSLSTPSREPAGKSFPSLAQPNRSEALGKPPTL
jgi:hypothetical protein